MAQITVYKTWATGDSISASDLNGVNSGIISALNALDSTNLVNGAVTSAKILDGTIATGDIADGAISTVKIADGAIASAKIAAGAVTTVKIADGAIASAKIATGGVAASNLVAGAVTQTAAPTLLKLFGREDAYRSGTAPPTAAAGGFLIQCGTHVGALDGSSFAVITLPTAFPNGSMCGFASDGDATAGLAYGKILGTSSLTKTTFTIRCTNHADVTMAGITVRIDWIAIGY